MSSGADKRWDYITQQHCPLPWTNLITVYWCEKCRTLHSE